MHAENFSPTKKKKKGEKEKEKHVAFTIIESFRMWVKQQLLVNAEFGPVLIESNK